MRLGLIVAAALLALTSSRAAQQGGETEDWHWNAATLGQAMPSRGDSYTDDRFDLAPPVEKSVLGEADDDKGGGGEVGSSPDAVISSQYTEGASRRCRNEPPYLYVTLHDYDNMLKYTLDGCLLDHKVLLDAPIEVRTELRGMTLTSQAAGAGSGSGSEGRHLLVANAGTGEPQLLLFGKCDPDSGRRRYKGTVVTDSASTGASHAYGVAVDEDRNVYASFQHTDVVLRFDGESFRPLPLPLALQSSPQRRDFWPGTFYQFGSSPSGDRSSAREQGVRDLLVIGRHVWVANEDVGGVLVVDTRSGVASDVVPVEAPVGLAFSEEHDLVFVGSKMKHWEGRVLAVDRRSLRVVREYKTLKMSHPTGIAVHGDTLFVAEQVRVCVCVCVSLSLSLSVSCLFSLASCHCPHPLPHSLSLTFSLFLAAQPPRRT